MDWVDLPGLEMEVLGDLPGLEGSVLGEVTRCSNSDTVAQKLSKLSIVADPRTPVKWRGRYLPAPAAEHKVAPTQMPIQLLLKVPKFKPFLARHREVMDGFNQVPKD